MTLSFLLVFFFSLFNVITCKVNVSSERATQEEKRSFHGHSSSSQYGHLIVNNELKKKRKLTRRDEGLLHSCVFAGEKIIPLYVRVFFFFVNR